MINCCLQCGKEILIYDKRKRRNHYCQGHSEYNGGKGKIVSEETRIKIANSLKKEKGYWYGKPAPNRGVPHTQEEKEKISKAGIGRLPVPSYKVEYTKKDGETIKLRSTWELEFAKYLDSINELWFYEFWTFNLGNMSYTPDFYLPRKELFIEIKGRWMANSKEKYDKFLDEYVFENIILVRSYPPYRDTLNGKI